MTSDAVLETGRDIAGKLDQRIRGHMEPGPVKVSAQPQQTRSFGKEGGEDVKHIVWAGHTVKNAQGQSFYGAAGVTVNGYYRAAEVQVYGPGQEKWNWLPERHTKQDYAVLAAQKKVRASYLGDLGSKMKKAVESRKNAAERYGAPHPGELHVQVSLLKRR